MTFEDSLKEHILRTLAPSINDLLTNVRRDAHEKVDEIINAKVASVALSVAKYVSVQDLQNRIVIEIRDLREEHR